MAQDNIQGQPERRRWGWICDNEAQEVVFASASAAVHDMGTRILPGEHDEGTIVAKAEKLGFRLVIVAVTMRIEAFLSPYP